METLKGNFDTQNQVILVKHRQGQRGENTGSQVVLFVKSLSVPFEQGLSGTTRPSRKRNRVIVLEQTTDDGGT